MHQIIKLAKKEKRSLLESEAKKILLENNISVPDFMLLKTEDDLKKIFGCVGYPVVMKIVSPDIIHKTEAGGVKIGIKNGKEALIAFREIIHNAKKYKSSAHIHGIIACKMIPQSTEIIIGMIKDPHFGPVIMFGLGGIFVEILKDVSFRVIPIEEKDAEDMIKEIAGYKMLQGIRGESPKNLKAIKELLFKISRIAIKNPEIMEIDLNPVFVFENGLQVIDARMIL